MSAPPPIRLFGERAEELEELTRLLYEEMVRIDPQPGDVPFEHLACYDRELYRCAVKAIFLRIRSRSVMRPTTIS
jgi:hypothetical protein